MVGKTSSEIPHGGASWLDNDYFRMALLLRLGEISIPDGAVCQITAASGEQCLKAMRNPCVHPHLCKKDPARLRPHRAIMMAIKNMCEKAHAFVDLERAIPAL